MVITAFYNLTLEVTLLFPYSICYKQATRFSLHSRGGNYTRARMPGGLRHWEPFWEQLTQIRSQIRKHGCPLALKFIHTHVASWSDSVVFHDPNLNSQGEVSDRIA